MPSCRGDGVRGATVVAGEQHRREAETAEVGDRGLRCLLDGVGDDDHCTDPAVHRHPYRGLAVGLGAVCRLAKLNGRHEPALVPQPAVAPRGDHMTLDDACDASAAVVFEVRHRGQRAGLGGARCDGTPDRMFRCVLESACQREHFGACLITGCVHGCDRHLTGRHRAGLVEHDGVDPSRRLQNLQDP